MKESQLAEVSKLDLDWQNLAEERIKEAEEKQAPLRYKDAIRDSENAFYITIGKQKGPYTVVFFDARLSFAEGNGINSVVVLEEGKQTRLMLQYVEEDHLEWKLLPTSDIQDILALDLESFRRAKLFDLSKDTWKGQYPNVDKVIKALDE